ncbi:putative vacuolar membrane transporter for cationic amino acids [Coemansia sp. RSA 2599]|nr:putative vacuolar membrane transporter for cationic amino acids [Coemansia sp. RSA 2599]
MVGINVLISNFFGYLSIACWIVVLVPQILLNHKRKSCDGVSLAFYLMWSLGDLFNLAGALMEGLILTAILLPLYYILTDCIVLLQFYIYRNNHICSCNDPGRAADEESALIATHHSPGHACSVEDESRCENSNCRCRLHDRPQEDSRDGDQLVSSRSARRALICVALALLLTTFVVHYYHVNKHWFDHIDKRRAAAQLLGYMSAAVYLGAYIPQLVRNYMTKSTEGLSMLMFIIVIIANITYCLSILTFHRPSREYLEKYASWLLGASGTIWLELGVLYQFYLYRCSHSHSSSSEQHAQPLAHDGDD